MTGIEAVCAVLALWAAGATVIAFLACCRSLEWQRRHRDLLAKPFSFWQHRETMRALMERTKLGSFRAVPPIEPTDGVVAFRRPPNMGEPL